MKILVGFNEASIGTNKGRGCLCMENEPHPYDLTWVCLRALVFQARRPLPNEKDHTLSSHCKINYGGFEEDVRLDRLLGESGRDVYTIDAWGTLRVEF